MDDFDGNSSPTSGTNGDASPPDQTDTSTSSTTAVGNDGSQAQGLQAAGQDADTNAGAGLVGDPSTSCTQGVLANNAPPPPQLVPGALEVTVLDALDRVTPIQGAQVTAQSGSEAALGTTNTSGQVLFSPLDPDVNWVVTASRSDCTQDTDGQFVPQFSVNNPVQLTLYITPVTVSLILPLSVACPGHPFEIDATGSPPGGNYAWSISGNGQLTDSSGVNPLTTGAQVFLVSYRPDNSAGSIPPRNDIVVTVTYSLDGASPSASQQVPIHGIDFVVTGDVQVSNIKANEEDPQQLIIEFDHVTQVREVFTQNFQVQIKLGDGTAGNSCPRPDQCAFNHRVGWLQNVLASYGQARYNDTQIDAVISNTPCRDSTKDDPLPPWAVLLNTRRFFKDGDTQNAFHSDYPGIKFNWQDPRPGAPAGSQLLSAFFASTLTSWLVVQNIEWSNHDMAGSFVFLRNFTWSTVLGTTVEMTQPVGSMCSPQSAPVLITVPLGQGQGTSSPVLDGPIADNSVNVQIVQAPHMP